MNSTSKKRLGLSILTGVVALTISVIFAGSLHGQALLGDITLASTSDTGVKGNNGSDFVSRPSDDGTKVAFLSTASNLDPADMDFVSDIYVKDLVTGNITLASTSDTGVKGNGTCREPSLSGDGTKVAFLSNATNLDPDSDGLFHPYVKDLVSGDITLASRSDAGVKGNASSGFALSLSDDGTRVAFSSAANNLDPADVDFVFDLYVKNLVSGDITLASRSDAGVKGNGASDFPSLSADGTRVAFSSNSSNLDPADPTPNGIQTST